MPDQLPPARRWHLAIDARDVLSGVGGAFVLVGAAAFHWALALMVAGAGMIGLAWRLSREA